MTAIRRAAATALAVAGAAALLLGGGAAPTRASTARRSPVVLLRLGGAMGSAVPAGFLGLSLETYGVVPYTGTGATNPILAALIRALSPSGGLVLRIGGDSADQTWWPTPGMVRPRGVSFDLSAGWAAALRRLSAATGARYILDLNLASDRPRLAGDEARSMLRSVGGRRIVAFEIGNEPERYVAEGYRHAGYDFADYAREFARWRADLPASPLAGPVTGAPSWLDQTGGLESAQPALRQITDHYYALNRCVTDPRSPKYPSVAHLLTLAASRGRVASIAPAVALAHRDGRVFRVDELNAVTCHGYAGVSNTFASALWVIDTLFELRRLGVDGANIHMWPGAPAAQLFTFTRSGGHVRPLYYGLLFFTQAAPAGSRLLTVHATANRDLRTWATIAPDGTRRVVLIDDGAQAITVRVRAPAGAPAATVARLSAPRASATAGVSLAGRSFGATTTSGTLPGPPRLRSVASAGGAYTVTVPGASAVLLTEPAA